MMLDANEREIVSPLDRIAGMALPSGSIDAVTIGSAPIGNMSDEARREWDTIAAANSAALTALLATRQHNVEAMDQVVPVERLNGQFSYLAAFVAASIEPQIEDGERAGDGGPNGGGDDCGGECIELHVFVRIIAAMIGGAFAGWGAVMLFYLLAERPRLSDGSESDERGQRLVPSA